MDKKPYCNNCSGLSGRIFVTVVVEDIYCSECGRLLYRKGREMQSPLCKNCQDPMPGKMIHVTIERTKHRGSVTRCAYCGREVTSGGSS